MARISLRGTGASRLVSSEDVGGVTQTRWVLLRRLLRVLYSSLRFLQIPEEVVQNNTIPVCQ